MHEDVRMSLQDRLNDIGELFVSSCDDFNKNPPTIMLFIMKNTTDGRVETNCKTLIQNGHLTAIKNTFEEILISIKEKLN